jgi:hypothetical protein
MALWSTQSIIEISTRNIFWRVKVVCGLGWQTYHLHVLIFLNSGSINLLEPSGPVQGLIYLYCYLYFVALELSKLAKNYGFSVHRLSWALSEGKGKALPWQAMQAQRGLGRLRLLHF